MSTTIEDRVILLLREESQQLSSPNKEDSGFLGRIKSTFADALPKRPYGFWETLERSTSISAQRWRKAYARRQRPTSDMIESLAQLFPHYAFWLVTGVTDGVNGHTAPRTAQLFPERAYIPTGSSQAYFRAEIALFKKLFQEGNVDVTDDKVRMYAAERTRPLSRWLDSQLVDAAYQIASSEEYDHLKTLWNRRENERVSLVTYITEPDKRPDSAVREKISSSEIRTSKTQGVNSKSKYQNDWELFYEPEDSHKTKFALSVLNIIPGQLSDEQLAAISSMKFIDVNDYLIFHGVDSKFVFPPGAIRFSEENLRPDEIERLMKLVMEERKKSNDNQIR